MTIESFAGPSSATSLGNFVTGLGNFDVVVTFSEPVILLTADNFDVDNGDAISLTGLNTDTITVTIKPNGNGNIQISIPAGSATNRSATVLNTASEVHTVTYIALTPVTVESVVGPTSVTGLGEFDVVVTFSVPVIRIGIPAFIVTNVDTIRITGHGTDTYTITFKPNGMGDIVISLLANTANSNTGNTNATTDILTATYTPAPPPDDNANGSCFSNRPSTV